jgi:hypothetical protein
MLTLFVVLQLALDIGFVVLVVTALRRARAAERAAQAAAEAQPRLTLLAEEILGALEPVLAALESGRLGTPPGAGAQGGAADTRGRREDRQRRAFERLRAGASPEAVMRDEQLRPGEARLIANLVAAARRAGHGG